MTVQELIEELQALPGHILVAVSDEDLRRPWTAISVTNVVTKEITMLDGKGRGDANPITVAYLATDNE